MKSDELLLERLALVRFGDKFQTEDVAKKLRNELLVFQRQQGMHPTITESAIMQWFSGEVEGPKRLKAKAFLWQYVTWIGNKRLFQKEQQKAFSELELMLRSYSGTDHNGSDNNMRTALEAEGGVVSTQISNASSGALRKNEEADDWACAHAWGDAEDRIRKLRSIEGLYQTIRPYAVSGMKQYVLEPLQIRAVAYGDDKSLKSYSHNHPESEYMYRGDIEISHHNVFGWMHRKRSSDEKAHSVRAIIMHVWFSMIGGKYAARHCLSGILLRGGSSKAGRNIAAAVPFIAIRPQRATTWLDGKNIEKVGRDIYHLGQGIMIGIVSKEHAEAYRFCDFYIRKYYSKYCKQQFAIFCFA